MAYGDKEGKKNKKEMNDVTSMVQPEDDKHKVGYKPSEKDQEVIHFVDKRFQRMKSERGNWEAIWAAADKAYRQEVDSVPSGDDWRAKFVPPMTFAIIETEMAELEDSSLGIVIRPQEDNDKGNAKLMQSVVDFTWKRGDGDVQWMKTRKSALVRGTGIGKETYRCDRKVVKEVKDYDKETQEIEWEAKETFEFNDVYYKNVNLYDFYIDEMAGDDGMESARDCIEREILDIDRFREKYARYKNVEYVTIGGDTARHEGDKTPQEGENRDVEILHYWNQVEDLYVIVANNVLITTCDRPNPYKHKRLPFIRIVNYSLPGQFYGLGEVKVLEGVQAEMTAIRRLALDNAKLNTNKMFVVSDNAVLDEDELISRPGGKVTLYGDVDKAIRWIDYPPLGRDWVTQYDELRSDARRASGISEESQGTPQSDTATQSAILREAAQKRIRYKNKFFKKMGLVQVGRMRVANVQQFYTEPMVERVVGEDGLEKMEEHYRTIRVDMKNGYTFFEATPEKIRGQFDIDVDVETIVPISRAMTQQKEIEIYNLTVNNPVVDPTKATKMLYEAFNKNPYDYLQDEQATGTTEEDQIRTAYEHHEALMGGQMVEPLDNPTPEHIGAHIELMQQAGQQLLENEELQRIYTEHVEAERSLVEGGGEQGMGSEQQMVQAATGDSPQGSRFAPAPAVIDQQQADEGMGQNVARGMGL